MATVGLTALGSLTGGSTVSVKLIGLEAVKRSMKSVDRRLRRRVRREVDEAGELVRDEARRRVPRRTSRLKRSISFSSRVLSAERFEVEVGTVKSRRVFWGHFVEYGTVRTRAFPFLQPAVDATADKVTALIGRSFEVI